MRLKQEGRTGSRHQFVALTADEEGGKSNGAKFLVEQTIWLTRLIAWKRRRQRAV
jgi:hypothetical protein